MTLDPKKIALYFQGTFGSTTMSMKQKQDIAEEAAASGFGTIILSQWHVHDDGTIYYNDKPLSAVLDTLNEIVPLLKKGGSVQKVLLSFGPFTSDFENISNNLDNFQSQIKSVQQSSGIDGLDWDLEGEYGKYSDLLVSLTLWAGGLGMMVTAAPFVCTSEWVNILKQTNGGESGFAWWNLQLYGGADFESWVEALAGSVDDPQSFLVPGYSVKQGATPSVVMKEIKTLFGSEPKLAGGFIWHYEAIVKAGYTMAQYASAIASIGA